MYLYLNGGRQALLNRFRLIGCRYNEIVYAPAFPVQGPPGHDGPVGCDLEIDIFVPRRDGVEQTSVIPYKKEK